MRPGGKSKVLLVLLCSAMCFVAIWVVRSRLKSATAEAARTAQELANLKQSMQAIADDPSRPTVIYEAPRIERVPDITPAAAAASVAAPAKPVDPLAGLAPDEKHYRLGVINEAQAKLVSTTLEHEPQDPTWSSTAAQLLRSTYQGEDFAGVDISAACKSTICKVSLTSSDAMQGEKALRKMLQKQPWPTNGFAGFDREKQEGYMYVAREGTELPRVDPASLTY